MSKSAQHLYSRLVRPVDDDDSAGEATPDVAANGLRIIGASALPNAGDQVANAGTVLPWPLTALGTPVGLISLLVPIRESGSMLPQAWLSPRTQQRAQRRWVWVAGALVQAASAAAMAAAADRKSTR